MSYENEPILVIPPETSGLAILRAIDAWARVENAPYTPRYWHQREERHCLWSATACAVVPSAACID